jgi:hypothetical protein
LVTETASATLTLPVQVTGSLASVFGLPANAAITARSADVYQVTNPWTANFSGVSAVVAFRSISADSITAVLHQVTDFLTNLEKGSLLGENVPLIDTSFASLYGLSGRFAVIADNFANDPAASLQSLKAKLDQAIGDAIGAAGDYANFTYSATTQEFKLTLNVVPTARSITAPLDINFADLGLGLLANLPGVGALVDVLGAARWRLTRPPTAIWFSASISALRCLLRRSSPRRPPLRSGCWSPIRPRSPCVSAERRFSSRCEVAARDSRRR